MPVKSIDNFSPELINVLLRGGIEAQVFYAEDDHAPPQVARIVKLLHVNIKSEATSLTSRQTRTRWHVLTFSSEKAASRFVELTKMSQQLHSLRGAMRASGDARTEQVFRARISLDEKAGALRVYPVKDQFADILAQRRDVVEVSSLPHDPLAQLALDGNIYIEGDDS